MCADFSSFLHSTTLSSCLKYIANPALQVSNSGPSPAAACLAVGPFPPLRFGLVECWKAGAFLLMHHTVS